MAPVVYSLYVPMSFNYLMHVRFVMDIMEHNWYAALGIATLTSRC